LLQVAWLVDGDPWVLLRLRGLAPETLPAELAAIPPETSDPIDDLEDLDDDLPAALDAALRAARVVALADHPGAEIAHLL
jgi:hypothetical protein